MRQIVVIFVLVSNEKGFLSRNLYLGWFSVVWKVLQNYGCPILPYQYG